MKDGRDKAKRHQQLCCVGDSFDIQRRVTKHASHDSGNIKASSISSHHHSSRQTQNQKSGQHTWGHPTLDGMHHRGACHLWLCSCLQSRVLSLTINNSQSLTLCSAVSIRPRDTPRVEMTMATGDRLNSICFQSSSFAGSLTRSLLAVGESFERQVELVHMKARLRARLRVTNRWATPQLTQAAGTNRYLWDTSTRQTTPPAAVEKQKEAVRAVKQ